MTVNILAHSTFKIDGARTLSKLDAKVGAYAVLSDGHRPDGKLYAGIPRVGPLSRRDFRVALSTPSFW